MIIDFSIKNFGSIKEEVSLSFEASKSKDLEKYYIMEPIKGLRLLKLGLVFGPNASGKTTVLNALNFLRGMVLHPFDTKTKTFNFQPFLFNDKSPKENTHFSLRFVCEGIKFHYQLELNQYCVVKEQMDFYAPYKALLFSRTSNEKEQTSEIEFGSKIKIPKNQQERLASNTLWNNTVLGGYLKTNVTSVELLQQAVRWFQDYLTAIIKPRTSLFPFITNKIENKEIDKSLLISYLQKADFKITDIEISDEPLNKSLLDVIIKNSLNPLPEEIKQKAEEGTLTTKKVHFQHHIQNEDFKLPYQAESEGTKRYYELGGLLSLNKPNGYFLLIDELESSLHPDLLVHFLLAFLSNTRNSQILVTSHYREFLMEKDLFRPDIIWFTDKKKDGSTELFSLSDFGSLVVRDTSSYYNAYKIGKLGAKPELQDPYNSKANG